MNLNFTFAREIELLDKGDVATNGAIYPTRYSIRGNTIVKENWKPFPSQIQRQFNV